MSLNVKIFVLAFFAFCLIDKSWGQPSSCPSGYTISGYHCVQSSPPTPTPPTSCSSDQEKVNGSCVSKCSSNQHREGTSCVCNSGYDSYGGSCVASCGGNAHHEGTGGACVCNGGYERVNGSCVAACGSGTERLSNGSCATPCNSNQHRDGTSCVCNSGYDSYGANCVASCGANAHHEGTGGACACNGGYERFNGNCVSTCAASEERLSSGVCAAKCAVNQQRLTNGSCMIICGANQYPSGPSVCNCNAGYDRLSNNQCVLQCADSQKRVGNECVSKCSSGETYKNGTCSCSDNYVRVNGLSGCYPKCTGNTYRNGSSCIDCGSYAHAEQENTSCACNTGYTLVNGVCNIICSDREDRASQNSCKCKSNYLKVGGTCLKNCSFSYDSVDYVDLNIILKHGETVQVYEKGIVSSDQDCIQKIRTCSDGVLDNSGNKKYCFKDTPITDKTFIGQISLSYKKVFGELLYPSMAKKFEELYGKPENAIYKTKHDYPVGKAPENGGVGKILIENIDLKLTQINLYLSKDQTIPDVQPLQSFIGGDVAANKLDPYFIEKNVSISTKIIDEVTYINTCVQFPGFTIYGDTKEVRRDYSFDYAFRDVNILGQKFGYPWFAQGRVSVNWIITPPKAISKGARICALSKLTQDPQYRSIPVVTLLHLSELEFDLNVINGKVEMTKSCPSGSKSDCENAINGNLANDVTYGLLIKKAFEGSFITDAGKFLASQSSINNGENGVLGSAVEGLLDGKPFNKALYLALFAKPFNYTISDINMQLNSTMRQNMVTILNTAENQCKNTILTFIPTASNVVTASAIQPYLSYCEQIASWVHRYSIEDEKSTELGCNDIKKYLKTDAYNVLEWGKYSGEPWIKNYISEGNRNSELNSVVNDYIGCRHVVTVKADLPKKMHPFIACQLAGANYAANKDNFNYKTLGCEKFLPAELLLCVTDPKKCKDILINCASNTQQCQSDINEKINNVCQGTDPVSCANTILNGLN